MRVAVSNWLRALAVSAAWGGILASGMSARGGEDPPRSLANWRTRPVDRLRLPRFEDGPRIRHTEQGWLVQSARFQVLTGGSREEAEWAAGQVADSWRSMERLADHWTEVHNQPDFALGAVVVVVADPDDRRNFLGPAGTFAAPEALPTMEYAGGQTLIRVIRDPDDASGATATAQLRHAAAHAFLHAGQFDRTLPAWTREGLARYVTQAGLEPDDRESAMQHLHPPLPSRNSIVNGPDAPDAELVRQTLEASEFVAFLLEGEDATHAGEFFQSLRRTVADARIAPAERFALNGPGPRAAEIVSAPLQGLAVEHDQAFARWRENPLAGQPLLVDAEKLAPEIEPTARQLAFVLKLLRRFGNEPRTRSSVKVQEFGRPAAAEAASPAVATPHSVDLRRFYRRLLEQQPFWATIGPEGDLLLSSDRERLAAALEVLRSPRVAARHVDRSWQVAYHLRDGRRIQARYEEPRQPATRPEIRFELSPLSGR